ncbi:hypothetical protein OOZ19_21780 [Saccharopolyspora sp. NFXS83]|uniref:hypothetical protein n=1 Tax=Saccharopolyspora sp. NFXS83 TaxID=2993560 RepID=UPI00224B52DB|nr:hypothetical protein [Saccharopolyspora sp. NFXS83]MCX2732877.1 hypothetical protein [Saccharopolyspora sp. NFXS83]
MKRSLTTVAAVLAGAGAVGFSGTAQAAPQFPAELPVDNGIAQTAFHGAGTLHGVQRTVGDVVRAPQALAEQAGEASGRTGESNIIGDTLHDLTQAHTHPVNTQGATIPLGGVIPASKARAGATPIDGVTQAPATRGITDFVDTTGNAMLDLINQIPPEQLNANNNVSAENGQPGAAGTGGQDGADGKPGGTSSAVNTPTTKPTTAGTPKGGLLDLSNAGGAIGKPLADGLTGTPLAGLAGLPQNGSTNGDA